MGNQRGTFAKRRREQNLKDKALHKKERLAARRAEALAAKLAPPASPDEAPGNGAPSDAPTEGASVTSDNLQQGMASSGGASDVTGDVQGGRVSATGEGSRP
jgi:hypothetical protein